MGPQRRDFVARREKRPADLVCFEMVGALGLGRKGGGWSVEVDAWAEVQGFRIKDFGRELILLDSLHC